MKSTSKSTKSAKARPAKVFSDVELEAMRDTKSERRRTGKADGEHDLLARIAAIKQPDRALAERIHAIVKTNAPSLSPKTWYGMPAYAKDGKNICFFQSGQKFKTRYATFGFAEAAKLDDGNMWPTAFALLKLTAADEARIVALLKKAVG
ncbi:MAG: DUF1801 domain-containing protein [Cucumibacter sp.]